MTGDERSAVPREPEDELRRLWPSLTDPQRWALVYTAATMVVPRQWPEYDRWVTPEQEPAPDNPTWTHPEVEDPGDGNRVIPLGTKILRPASDPPREPAHKERQGLEEPERP